MLKTVRPHRILLFAVLWASLFFLPWQDWLEALPWIRLAITLTLFVVPGTAASMLIVDKAFSFLGHIFSGIAISILIIGIFGLLGRVFNYPFSYIKFLFVTIGILLLILLSIKEQNGTELNIPKAYSAVTIIPFLIVSTLAIVNSLSQRFVGDDFHYLVYLTSWQHADPLGFQEVYNGIGGLDRIRYWINTFPMSLGFLSQISGLHGLLLNGLYLEPFLVVLSLAAVWVLFEKLLGSEYKASIALMIQFSFTLLFQRNYQFGAAFFNRLSEDKAFAAFILVPIFLYIALHWTQSFNLRSSVLLILAGWALGLTHPIILAYAVFIAGIYALLIVFIIRFNFRQFMVVMAVFAAIMFPPATLRMVEIPFVSRFLFRLETPAKQPGVFDVESAISRRPDVNKTRISDIPGTPFYGFHVDIVRYRTTNQDPATIFSWFYVYTLVAGFIWSLFALRKRNYAPFITASSMLILITGIPYTGWLIGYLVSLRMLWRAPWVVSIGLILFILLMEAYYALEPRIKSVGILKKVNIQRGLYYGVVLLSCIAVLSISEFRNNVRWGALNTLPPYHANLERLVGLGEYLDEALVRTSRFAGSRTHMNYLPGLSYKAKVFLFQSGGINAGSVPSRPKIMPLLSADPSYSISFRRELMMKHKLTHILTEDPLVRDYYAQYPNFFFIHEVNGFWIIEFLFLGL